MWLYVYCQLVAVEVLLILLIYFSFGFSVQKSSSDVLWENWENGLLTMNLGRDLLKLFFNRLTIIKF